MIYVGEVRVRHGWNAQQSGGVRRIRDHLLTTDSNAQESSTRPAAGIVTLACKTTVCIPQLTTSWWSHFSCILGLISDFFSFPVSVELVIYRMTDLWWLHVRFGTSSRSCFQNIPTASQLVLMVLKTTLPLRRKKCSRICQWALKLCVFSLVGYFYDAWGAESVFTRMIFTQKLNLPSWCFKLILNPKKYIFW